MPEPIIARGNSYEDPPIGPQPAICAFVEDIGTQISTFGTKQKELHQVVIFWELLAKMRQGEYAGQPFLIGKFYTLSLDRRSNLSKDLQTWMPTLKLTPEKRKAGLDLTKLIGRPAMLNISPRDDGNGVRITAVMSCQPTQAPQRVFRTSAPPGIARLRERSLEAQGQPVSDDRAAGPTEDLPPIDDDLGASEAPAEDIIPQDDLPF
jgi:hypothetical protein